ncbi:hypothetical protein [Isoptericola dokdonensis]|uniref:Uncharacterized protein n=1 Tax=Isoptericola dokdonensis DS-3 TaxID=1300344 RepID=A0A161II27_9MICO|nr:hypothetical protein [Isoptericola dokdonensis]ANC31464.1 hypothetical protein I598_1916 [Isoptericola dokdonensis DS-3]
MRERKPAPWSATIPEALWPGRLININDVRGHTRYTSKRTRPWRELGAGIGERLKAQHGAFTTPVRVWLEVRLPNNHRRDSGNLYPTVKALLDGVATDAGALPGDHDGVVEGPWIKRVYPNGPACLTFILEPMPPGALGVSRSAAAATFSTGVTSTSPPTP